MPARTRAEFFPILFSARAMLSLISSAALVGIEAVPVAVEVNTNEVGQAGMVLVGLLDTAVKESEERVYSALGNSGFKVPHTRTTINLAPGDLRKEGPAFDLPIALGLLASMDKLKKEALADYLIAGELSLSGATRPVRGGLAMAMLARQMRKRAVLLPTISAREAALVEGVAVYAVESLDQALRFINGEITLPRMRSELDESRAGDESGLDFCDVKGQQGVRRAVEVAVAGGHNLLMIGPPGSGKSMIAKRIPGIMPRPTLDEHLEVLRIHSAAGYTLQGGSQRLERPSRSPHHTISDVGLLGGGTIPGPGEISLAHHGVLFLDELPEFKRSALEVLRQPLEDGHVTISRSAGKITLPCNFMLVAAMNPCPCGYLGATQRECRCAPAQIQRYRARISGPLLDRIDLHVEAPALAVAELREARPGESSAAMRARVETARTQQRARFSETTTRANARMTHAQIKRYCPLDSTLGDMLQHAMEELNLSARAFDRIIKVARTIADLAGADDIAANHLLEAIQYRSLDRQLFY